MVVLVSVCAKFQPSSLFTSFQANKVRLIRKLIRLGKFGYLSQVGLVNVCAKFQLSSWPSSG